MGVHDIRPFARHHLTQGGNCPRIRPWRGVPSFRLDEQRPEFLDNVLDPVNPDAAVLLIQSQARMPERCNSDLVSSPSQFDCQILRDLLFTADDRRVELREHQDAQNIT